MGVVVRRNMPICIAVHSLLKMHSELDFDKVDNAVKTRMYLISNDDINISE